jgi:hypothetical protein
MPRRPRAHLPDTLMHIVQRGHSRASSEGLADGGVGNDYIEGGHYANMEIRGGANNDVLIDLALQTTSDDEPLARTDVPTVWNTNQSRICSRSKRAQRTARRMVDDQAEVRWAA